MGTFSRRTLLLGTGAVAGYATARVFGSRAPVLGGTTSLRPATASKTLNDASGLSETPIHKRINIGEDPGKALVTTLRKELKDAAAQGRPVNIGAARHSMGGHAIPRDGHAITFDTQFLEPDTAAQTYRAHAGLRWREVIAQLDPLGFGPKVMQSNHDFGVAATFCVNAHGWPVPHGPMGATVRSLEMVLPDGELVTCSRSQNADLFTHAMGGYGLTGLITRMDVEMAPNRRLVPTYEEMPSAAYADAMIAALSDPTVDMAYGRLNVDRARFFEDALLITYRPDADQDALPPAGTSGFMSKASRHIFRAQLGNERIKRWRWGIETGIGPAIAGGPVTRNTLINEPVVTLDDNDPNRTDILHEYFVAPDRFAEFITACQEVIPASYQSMLNITLRYVAADTESWLTYAPVPRIAAVMLFSQEMTARGEADMARMTRDLIDRVVAIGGSYYLPYRPHATPDQLLRAYPRAPEFVAKKREIDPKGVLRNGFWDRYLEAL